MKNRFEISIPNPCHADWDKMTPNKVGRHCATCDKLVIDFSKMTADEIKVYFKTNSGKKTCGHFYKGQLKTNKNKVQTFLTDLYCSAYLNIRTKTVRLSVLLILGCALTLAGCSTPTKGEVIERNQIIKGDSIVPITLDTIPQDTIKNGL